MRAYNEACPGSADKLIAMTEEVGRHRRAVELIRVNAEVENMRRDYWEGRMGQICAVLVAFAAIGGAAFAGTHNAQWTGSILGAGGLGTIVATFVYGRKNPRKPEERRAESIETPPE